MEPLSLALNGTSYPGSRWDLLAWQSVEPLTLAVNRGSSSAENQMIVTYWAIHQSPYWLRLDGF